MKFSISSNNLIAILGKKLTTQTSARCHVVDSFCFSHLVQLSGPRMWNILINDITNLPIYKGHVIFVTLLYKITHYLKNLGIVFIKSKLNLSG